MSKNKHAKSRSSVQTVALAAKDLIVIRPNWQEISEKIVIAENGEITIAGKTYPVKQLQMLSGLAEYQPNMQEFIGHIQDSQYKIRATVTTVLTNMIWNVDGRPLMVSIMLAKDVRTTRPVTGVLMFLQQQLAKGQPGRAILKVNRQCIAELALYLGLDAPSEVWSLGPVDVATWTISDSSADDMTKAFGIEDTLKTLYFLRGQEPRGYSRSLPHSIQYVDVPTGKAFTKLDRKQRNKLKDKKLAASRAQNKK